VSGSAPGGGGRVSVTLIGGSQAMPSRPFANTVVV
jgi:hypothetical protein